jgi:hypothetical protein
MRPEATDFEDELASRRTQRGGRRVPGRHLARTHGITAFFVQTCRGREENFYKNELA